MQRSDAELVQLIRNGDESAFKELVNRHSDYLYGLAYSQMGNAADAEDVLQETLLGAFRRFEAWSCNPATRGQLSSHTQLLLAHGDRRIC